MISQKKILIVEDNKINRFMLKEILSPQYTVLEAENGQEALSALDTQKDDISLILLDIIMPIMDGYTFLSHIKESPAHSSIPVIVTTQNDGESDEVAALAHGATDFIAKPYKPQVILHRVASIIKLRETAAMVNLFKYDRLTGLYSKAFFYQKAKELLIQNPNKEYDIICSDVENFKLTNDVFGIPTGDLLLCGIADMYTKLVETHGICGRFDADQFVCLTERPKQYTNEPFKQACVQINALTNAKNIVLKWGIYPVEDRSISLEQMCDRALLAARSIKGQYGKYYIIYNDELRDCLLREQAITDSMETALAEGQFEIYLQPKYRIKDEKLSGAEALVRWIHPEWGIQSPSMFIPLFEKNGFISKLDQYVWDKTCSILRKWSDSGYPPIPISVNVSRADIYQADLSNVLQKIIKKYKLTPSQLHLEITESAYTEDPNQIIETVDQLRKSGFVIEMDDFGKGYSSLNMLNRMPLDILKLDIEFIQSETVKPINQEILRFIMELARWMNLLVVAEGVETSEQLERLREIGCDYAQGYYFAKPMPYLQFENLMKEQSMVMKTIELYQTENKIEQQLPIILIADENEVYRNNAKLVFEENYQVIEIAEYQTLLDCISNYEKQIALIILSLKLAVSDGLTVLDLYEKKKINWPIPILATAPSNMEWEEKAFGMGAADFAGKPHSMKSLWKRAQTIIGIKMLQESQRILQDEIYHDYLTGLLNRRGLDAAIHLINNKNYPLTVYLFDFDNLKKVNHTFGHAIGDQLIILFGALIRSQIRSTDILARFGGDEFLVILKQYGSKKSAGKKVSEICQTIQGTCLMEQVSISCSVGIAVGNTENTAPEIINHAIIALRQAKKNKKGSYYIWND